jgi:hypothetical protein
VTGDGSLLKGKGIIIKMGGHKIGKNWYVTKENLEAFLDGGSQESKENIEK